VNYSDKSSQQCRLTYTVKRFNVEASWCRDFDPLKLVRVFISCILLRLWAGMWSRSEKNIFVLHPPLLPTDVSFSRLEISSPWVLAGRGRAYEHLFFRTTPLAIGCELLGVLHVALVGLNFLRE